MAAPTTSLSNVTVRKLNSVISSFWTKIKNTFAPKDDGQQTHDTTKFYRADGSWAVPTGGLDKIVFIDGTITRSGSGPYTYSVTCSTTYAQVSQYLSEGKVPVCKFSRSDTGQTWYFYYHMTYANNRHAFGSNDIYNVANNDTAYASCVYVKTDDSWTFIEVETYDNGYWLERLLDKVDTTGYASNTKSTFTKASGDTSSMASGSKLSALFTAISSFFASLKALAFKDTASYSDLSSGVKSSLDKADSALQASSIVSSITPGDTAHVPTADAVYQGIIAKAVRYDTNEQGLNSTQQSNARTNIGAGTSNLALGETASTAYRGDRGKIAYDHSQSAHAPAGIKTISTTGYVYYMEFAQATNGGSGGTSSVFLCAGIGDIGTNRASVLVHIGYRGTPSITANIISGVTGNGFGVGYYLDSNSVAHFVLKLPTWENDSARIYKLVTGTMSKYEVTNLGTSEPSGYVSGTVRTIALQEDNSVSLSGQTLTVKINGVTQSLTNTTYSAGTGLSLSGTTFSNAGVTAIAWNSTDKQLKYTKNSANYNITIGYATEAGDVASQSKLNTVGYVRSILYRKSANFDIPLTGLREGDLVIVFCTKSSGSITVTYNGSKAVVGATTVAAGRFRIYCYVNSSTGLIASES